MTTTKKLMALVALAALTACDRIERADRLRERADGVYQAAMDDYRAGRLDAAITGFEKAVRHDPANASARFQLACLQQDARHDFLEAYCGYREYILQQPSSDKAKLARDRLASCEKELAKALADKYGLAGAKGLRDELALAARKLKATEARVAASEQEIATLSAKVAALTAERGRLLQIVKDGAGAEELAAAKPPSAREAKDLLEESDEDEAARPSAEAAALKKESDEELRPAARPAGEVAALKGEESGEVSSGSSLLPAQDPGAEARRDAAPPAKAKPAEPARPKTYTVQEGDTLYGISKRFYGRLSMWKAIREANKELIPMDNRVRAGDTLKLP